MTCAGCGREAGEEQRFCTGCGRALPAECPRCGRPAGAGDRFCGGCGAALATGEGERTPGQYTPRHLAERILRQRGAIEGERKEVSVLFADIKGSMDLAAAVDPEEWHGVLDRFFAIASEGIHRFEGSVNQYTGDGLMALFGAPLALEDHARHACTAALWLRDAVRELGRELRREKGIDFAVRFGLNSGVVVVGAIGDDLRMDYTAQGQVVGLAARMEQLAAAGSIYLAPATAKLVQSYFEIEDLGLFQVKGVEERLRVHELHAAAGARSRFDAARQRGLSRFVGRERELERLQGIAVNAVGPRRAAVVARAGQGKSRLCLEILARRRAAGAAIFEAVGLSHARGISYLPLLQLFRAALGVAEGERGAAVRERVAGRMLLLGERFRPHVAAVCELLGLDDGIAPPAAASAAGGDRAVRQTRLLEALSALLRADTGDGVVLLLEDLHWFDPASESFLRELLRSHLQDDVFAIATLRPDYDGAWLADAGFQSILLEPLDAAAMRELVLGLIGGDADLEELVGVVAERAGGNPFFAEEIVRSLVESGALHGSPGHYRSAGPVGATMGAIEIPGSVQAVLAARIDRLDGEAKAVLQAGAVIGKSFARAVLEPVCALPSADLDAALSTLVERGFVYATSYQPTAEYSFEHPLTQEVAEGTMLTSSRRALHSAVARAIEAVDPGGADRHAALIAEHWEASGAMNEAARWHMRAARWSNLGDVRQTAAHWKRICQIVPADCGDAELLAIRLRACREQISLAARIDLRSAEIAPIREEGVAAAVRLGDRAAQAAIESSFALNRSLEGDLRGALQSLDAVRPFAEDGDDLEAVSDFAVTSSHVYGWSGRCMDQIGVCDVALSRAAANEGLIAEGILAWLHAMRGDGLTHHGAFEHSAAELETAMRMAASDKNAEVRGFTQAYMIRLHTLAGRYEEADEAAARALRLGEESGSVGVVGTTMALHAATHVAAGRWQRAIEQVEGGIEFLDQGRVVLFRSFVLLHAALAYAGADDYAKARDFSHRAIEVAEDCGAIGIAALARLAAVGPAIHDRDADTARRLVDEAEASLTALQLFAYEPDVHLARARIATALGDGAAAPQWRQRAIETLRRIGAPRRADALGG